MMRHVALVGGLVAAGLWAQGPQFAPGGHMGPRGEGMGRMEHAQVVTGAPYSAVETTVRQQTLATGNVIQRQEQTSLYRDSEGRVRTETTFQGPEGQPGRSMITISDPVAQMVRTLDPQAKTVHEMAMHTPQGRGAAFSHAAGSPHANHESANVVKQDLGMQTINGLAATGTRMTRTIPAGAIGNAQAIQTIHEVWISSDLKVPLMTKISDPRFGTIVTQLTNVVRAEPDASLFVAPADYTVAAGPHMHGAARPTGGPASQ